jgi:archaemetzincin
VPNLLLVPIYLPPEPPLLAPLVQQLGRTFATAVTVQPPWFDPERCFDSSRGQYHSTEMLAELLAEPAAAAAQAGARILGVTSVDLFIPILTYVFGEAQLDGRAAVVSTYRLDNTHYGLPGNQRLLLDRLLKEATHELGHTHGLVHCLDPSCVMHSSTYVEDVDVKSAQFCGACAGQVRRS